MAEQKYFKEPISVRSHFKTDENLLELTPRESRRYRRGYGITGRQFRIEVRRQRVKAKRLAELREAAKKAKKRKPRKAAAK